MAGAGVKETVTGKLGPLPVWAWAVGVTVPLVVIMRIRASRKAKAAAAAADTVAANANDATSSVPSTMVPSTSLSSGYAPSGLYAGGNPGGIWSGDTSGASGVTPATAAAPATNSAWRNIAADKLVANGYSPSVVLDALTRILAGQPITGQQEALYNEAVRAVGSQPPEGIPTITRTADPTPSPTTPTPAAPTPVVAAVTPPPPAPAAGGLTGVAGPGETLYAMTKRVTGHYPSVPELRRIAALNGKTVGPPPNYVVNLRTGETVRFN